MDAPVVIVGSGLAGWNLAREFRKLDKQTPLVVVSRDGAGFYSKPMLSNALASNKSAQTLLMKPADKMAAEVGATVLARTEVLGIDVAARTLSLSGGRTQPWRDLVLALGAARAFRCAAALRPPLDDGESAVKWALKLGALALVSRQTDSYVRWWEARAHIAETVQRLAHRLEQEPWEPYARGTLWMAWLGLMGAPVAVLPENAADELPMLSATRSRLAAFRERRADHDVPGDGPVHNAAALRARMTEFAIRHLADATELLTVAVLRRTLPDVSAEFKLHLSAARSAMAGDHGQDVLLAWLQAAGVTLAGGVTAQLELPGF